MAITDHCTVLVSILLRLIVIFSAPLLQSLVGTELLSPEL
jgi:hypothetical protein